MATGLAGNGRLTNRRHGAGQLDGVVQVGLGVFGMGQSKPVGVNIETETGNERRHDDHGGTFADARLEASAGEVSIAAGAAEGFGPARQARAGRRRLHPWGESPAKRVGPVGEADGGAVEGDGGHVEFQPACGPIECLGRGATAGEGDGHGNLGFAATGERLFDVLFVDHRIEGKDPDGPAAAHIVGEGGSGFGAGARTEERAGEAGQATAAGGGRRDVVCQPGVQEG